MKQFRVKLNEVEHVKEFCRICNTLDFNLDIKSGKYLTDAKSLLGLFALKLSEPVTVLVDDINYKQAVEALKDFIVE